MSIDKVRSYFKTFGMEERILEFPVSSATVELAAEALHTEGKRIAKTMSFKVGDGAMLILLAGDARVDNHKFKERFGTKAKMLTPEEVDEFIGHSIGGVCPFGIPENVPVYLDESLKRFYTVFPAAGSANSAIELNMEDLYKYSNASGWVDVGKDWDGRYEPKVTVCELPTDGLSDGEITLRLIRFRPADVKKGFVPAYDFDIIDNQTGGIAGKCDLRIGYCLGTYYGGNIGYTVFEPYRGRHYARNASRLLMELAKRHGMPYLIICCNEDNAPSRTTLEHLDGTLIEIADVPPYTESYRSGLRRSCVFRYELT